MAERCAAGNQLERTASNIGMIREALTRLTTKNARHRASASAIASKSLGASLEVERQLDPHFARQFVFAQSTKYRMPQLSTPGPFKE
jgi:hypothetical protein